MNEIKYSSYLTFFLMCAQKSAKVVYFSILTKFQAKIFIFSLRWVFYKIKNTAIFLQYSGILHFFILFYILPISLSRG